eukprot:g6397.t1
MDKGAARLTHQAWVERKDRQRREEIARAVAAKKREQQQKENRAAGNNALKFGKWLAVKDKYERAVALLEQLNLPVHSDDGDMIGLGAQGGAGADDGKQMRVEVEEKWRALGVAMCAADCALILLHRQDKGGGDRYSKLKKLGQHWLDWTMAHVKDSQQNRTFSNVELTAGQAAVVKRSENLRQNLVEEEGKPSKLRHLAYVNMYKKEAKKPGKQAAKPTGLASKRVLKPDEKLMNRLYMARLKEELEAAQKTVVRRLLQEREEWLKQADDGLGGGGGAMDAASSAERSRQEQRFLHRIGIGQLQKWAEEDLEASERKAEKKRAKDVAEAERAHTRWAERQAKFRLRAPQEWQGREQAVKFGGKWQPPRFDFGRGKPLVRADKVKIPKTKADTAKRTGAKYIWAGKEVAHRMCEERLRAKASSGKQERQLTRARTAAAQFEDWLSQKELVSRARECIKGIKKPEKGELKQEQHWAAVGEALKKVDAIVLFADWCDWSADFKPPGTCRQYWESFAPMGCAVMTGGPIRDLLLKILNRPGVNWKKVVMEQVERRWAAKVALATHVKNKGKDMRGMSVDDAEKITTADMEPEYRDSKGECYAPQSIMGRQGAKTLCIEWDPPTPHELKLHMDWSAYDLEVGDLAAITSRLGISLTNEEMVRLVTTFDLDGDGTVSVEEFLAFTGTKRSKAGGDALQQLRRVCSWETVCHKTGMQNAYQVVVEGNAVRRKQLPDHKKRIRMQPFKRMFEAGEDKDLQRHTEDINELRRLTRSGFVPAEIKSASGRGNSTRYTVVFQDGLANAEAKGLFAFQLQHEDDAKKGDAFAKGDKVKARMLSPAATWTPQQRREGLSFLLERSATHRKEQLLRKRVTGGSPPQAPQLIVAAFRSEEAARYRDTHGKKALKAESELLLRWSPSATGSAGEVPSFYVLEYSRKKSDGPDSDWATLVRDPKDFTDNGGQPRYVWKRKAGDGDLEWYKASGLEPNTAYNFRLRAFNGYGASPPTRRVVTTYPPKPPRPTARWATQDKVCISWGHDTRASDRMQQLERLFDDCAHAAGEAEDEERASRDDLLDALEDAKNASLLRFVQDVKVEDAAAGAEPVSAFDMIEMSDNDEIGRAEFMGYFSAAMGRKGALTGAQRRPDPSIGTKFALLQCLSDASNEYVIVYRGAQTHFVVCDLKPGTSYQFRVQAQNESQHNDETPDGLDGGEKEVQKSRYSEGMVVQTMLAAPDAPRLAAAEQARQLTLTWPHTTLTKNAASGAQEAKKGGREKDKVDKVLTEWTRADKDSDGGVDVKRMWDQFLAVADTDGDGTLSKEEFKVLLPELGVDASPARLNELFEVADSGGDGAVCYEEFEAWYTKQGLTYTIKQDEGMSDE